MGPATYALGQVHARALASLMLVPDANMWSRVPTIIAFCELVTRIPKVQPDQYALGNEDQQASLTTFVGQRIREALQRHGQDFANILHSVPQTTLNVFAT